MPDDARIDMDRSAEFVPTLYVPSRWRELPRTVYYRWGLMATLHAVGVEGTVSLARWGGNFVWEHSPVLRDSILKTMGQAFGETHDDEQVRALAKTYMRDMRLHLVETEFVHRRMNAGTWSRYVRCVGLEPLIETVGRGGGVVGAAAYLGNHQVGMTALGLMLSGRVAGIVSPCQYSTQYRWMAGLVRRRLARLHPIGDAVGPALGALREGRLVLLISEHLSSGKSGMAVEFLGRTRRFHPTGAMLSWRTRCPMAVITCRRLDEPFHFELRLHDWIVPPLSGDRREWIHTTTRRVLATLDAAIRSDFAQYPWTHEHLIAGRARQ